MWKRAFDVGGAAILRRSPAGRQLSSVAPDSVLLRSLEDHYLEFSEMSPPPKMKPPPPPFSVVERALERHGGPVLRRAYGEEEITIWVDRRSHILPGGDGDAAASGDVISELCLFVDVSKPGRERSLLFLCGLYPDGVGIHSICLKPNLSPASTSTYQGRVFQELHWRLRGAFHQYIETLGVNKSLFPFVQAWVYLKDYQNLMGWFKSVGTFIKE